MKPFSSSGKYSLFKVLQSTREMRQLLFRHVYTKSTVRRVEERSARPWRVSKGEPKRSTGKDRNGQTALRIHPFPMADAGRKNVSPALLTNQAFPSAQDWPVPLKSLPDYPTILST